MVVATGFEPVYHAYETCILTLLIQRPWCELLVRFERTYVRHTYLDYVATHSISVLYFTHSTSRYP